MTTTDVRRAVGAVVTGLSRRGGRPLSWRERRDVRWALTLKPADHAHAVDVHGVYVVFRREGHPDTLSPLHPPRSPGRATGKGRSSGWRSTT